MDLHDLDDPFDPDIDPDLTSDFGNGREATLAAACRLFLFFAQNERTALWHFCSTIAGAADAGRYRIRHPEFMSRSKACALFLTPHRPPAVNAENLPTVEDTGDDAIGLMVW